MKTTVEIEEKDRDEIWRVAHAIATSPTGGKDSFSILVEDVESAYRKLYGPNNPATPPLPGK